MLSSPLSGRNGWTCVDLIDLQSAEAVALRGLRELFGVRVRRFPVGQVRHLVRALDGESLLEHDVFGTTDPQRIATPAGEPQVLDAPVAVHPHDRGVPGLRRRLRSGARRAVQRR